MPPLTLSDDEQVTILTAALPLDRDRRDQFVHAVVSALQMHQVIGPGVVYRVAAEMQRVYFRPPRLDTPGSPAKYR